MDSLGTPLPIASPATTLPDLRARTARMAQEKSWIASAASLLPSSGAVFIDSGSTTMPLAELVPAHQELTVGTNSLPLAGAIVSAGGPTIKTLGARHFEGFAGLGEVALLTTDRGERGADVEKLRGVGLSVLVAGPEAPTAERGLFEDRGD